MSTPRRGRSAPAGQRGPGRPPGRGPRSQETQAHIYRTALELMARRGFAETTLRDLAKEAGVSLGLTYRYFPTKHAIVLGLYDELSQRFAAQTGAMPPGPWWPRFVWTLRLSLATIAPHRRLLSALLPVLLCRGEDGLFAPATSVSRERVQGAFTLAVQAADDAPPAAEAAALGRVLYLAHLGLLLFWLLDESEGLSASALLVERIEGLGPLAALVLHLPQARPALGWMDEVIDRAFYHPRPRDPEVKP